MAHAFPNMNNASHALPNSNARVQGSLYFHQSPHVNPSQWHTLYSFNNRYDHFEPHATGSHSNKTSSALLISFKA